MRTPSPRTRRLLLAPLLGLALWSVPPGSTPRYLATAAAAQLSMLWGRVPNEVVLASNTLTPEEAERLRQVPRIKAFGQRIGLSHTDNYDTISMGWSSTIYNVTGSDPLAFDPVMTWFPVVGAFPYLGFFDRDQAEAHADTMRRQGKDVWVRTAGAYSTLGWFRDPLLPHMLRWDEYGLAGTLLHELAHTTVWIPGSVSFNESFANFVGDVAAMQYLIDTYGEEHELVVEARARVVDRERWRAVMHGTYQDLEQVYADPSLSRDAKLARKRGIFASVPLRLARGGLERPERWIHWSRRTTWNNARMLQFRTYNDSLSSFQGVWEQEDQDLGRFMATIERVTAGSSDPYSALDAHVARGTP